MFGHQTFPVLTGLKFYLEAGLNMNRSEILINILKLIVINNSSS